MSSGSTITWMQTWSACGRCRGPAILDGSPMDHKQCIVDGAAIAYTETGSGPAIVFVHGVYVTGALWDDVVRQLGTKFRCVVPTWPLGGHEPVAEDVDLGCAAAARRIAHLLEVLDLHDVTVVANDTGGGLTLAAIGDDTLDLSRIRGLVLTNCDSYEHFPPASFRPIVQLCRLSPRLGGAVLRGLASGRGQQFFLKQVCRTTVAPARRAAIFGAFATDRLSRQQAVRFTASLDPALTLQAAAAIEQFDRAVTLAWGTDDKLFPVDHAKRLAEAFPYARLVEIRDCSTYVMIDAPKQLAAEISAAITPR
jgi:pimeloyl-ACP methyl ester carboxylesterase